MPIDKQLPRWTLSVLTITKREPYLAKLLRSLADANLPRGTVIDVVYNWDTREKPMEVERRLRRVGAGRQQQAGGGEEGHPARGHAGIAAVAPANGKRKKRFFSHLRERRTADPANLLVSRQQIGAGRGRRGLYFPAGRLGGLPRVAVVA